MALPYDMRAVGEKEFLVTWDDGLRQLFQNSNLRFACPCAQCVDERTGQRRITRAAIAENIRILNYEKVGHYAVRFTWSDGHQTGIFHFDFLRALGQAGDLPQSSSPSGSCC